MKMYRRKDKFVGYWTNMPEYTALGKLAKRNNVSVSQMMRAIMVDALYEEGLLGRIGQAGHSETSEIREASGAAQQ